MKTFTLRFLTSIASIAMLASIHAAPIQLGQEYRLIDLGRLPGTKASIPAAINNNGDVAGTASAGSEIETAFRYNATTGQLEKLSVKPLDSLTRAFGINDAGAVVGDSTFGPASPKRGESVRQAAIFSNGSAASLIDSSKVQRHSHAMDINNLHTVVGYASGDPEGKESSAFAWTKSAGMVELGTLGGAVAQALAINDAGYVTGHSATAPKTKTGAGEIHAFLGQVLDNGKTTPLKDLGTLGGSFSYGTAVSEKDHVVGYSTMNSDGSFHAFLYENEKMIDLGSLASDTVKTDQSFALGVNRTGQVVGYAFLPLDQAAQQVGFIYRDGKMADLNEMIGRAAKRYLIYIAEAINDQGQITATAFDRENNVFCAVVLTPVTLVGIE